MSAMLSNIRAALLLAFCGVAIFGLNACFHDDESENRGPKTPTIAPSTAQIPIAPRPSPDQSSLDPASSIEMGRSDSRSQAGETITLQARGTFTQTGDTPTDFEVCYYRSTDNQIDPDMDIKIGECKQVTTSSLNGNDDDFESLILIAPALPGTYYFGACIVNEPENEEKDICSTPPAKVIVEPVPSNDPTPPGNVSPSLGIELFSVSKTLVEVGDIIRLDATVGNTGGASSATMLRYYLSEDNVISGSEEDDVDLGGDIVSPLDQGVYGDEYFILSAPSVDNTKSPGTYYYGACVLDGRSETDTVIECTTGSQVRQVEVLPSSRSPQPGGLPDLDVGPISVSGVQLSADRIIEKFQGDTIDLEVTITNRGGSARETIIQWSRSQNEFLTSPELVNGKDKVSPLALGGKAVLAKNMHLSSLDLGDHYIFVCVDPAVATAIERTIDEENTDNNCSGEGEILVVRVTSNREATGNVTIDDGSTAQVGVQLEANTTDIDDPNDLTSPNLQYQWQRADDPSETNLSDVEGANSDVYTPVKERDQGKYLRVEVSFVDADGQLETLWSDWTRVVERRANTPAIGKVTIDGGENVHVGIELKANTSMIDDPVNGRAPSTSWRYLWQRAEEDGETGVPDDTTATDILGASTDRYTPTEDDEGKFLRVMVMFTDEDGYDEVVASAYVDIRPVYEIGDITIYEIGDKNKELPLTSHSTITISKPIRRIMFDVINRTSAMAYVNVYHSRNPEYSAFDTFIAHKPVYPNEEKETVGPGMPGHVVLPHGTNYIHACISNRITSNRNCSSIQVVWQSGTASATIQGNVVVGQIVTADTSHIDDLFRGSPPHYRFQWIREEGAGINISIHEIRGAVSRSYTLRRGDRYTRIGVIVTYDYQGTPVTSTSDYVWVGPPSHPTYNTKPDLDILFVSASDDRLQRGSPVTLRAVVTNRGYGYSTPTTLQFFRTNDNSVAWDTAVGGSIEVSSLRYGAVQTRYITVDAPPWRGVNYFGACIEIVDTEEFDRNNCTYPSESAKVEFSNSGPN